uniref:F-box domain-containing protein n=1 Tax=Gongylonema pulchrum TaxID=637853 RepID=A0A183DNR1_9BILA
LQSTASSRSSVQSPPRTFRSGGSTSGSLPSTGTMPYNLLPSSQKKSHSEPYAASAELLNLGMNTELSKLSDGRFERLARQLRKICPLHLVLNDHSYYQKRPPLLLFWFLKQLPNLRRLTLYSIRGDPHVELHKVFSVVGIDELNIIQPTDNACIVVNEGLLESFLKVSSPVRRRFRLRITGKTDITATALCNFIRKWRNHREIVPFHTILIDVSCVAPSEFIHATKCPGCHECSDEFVRHRSVSTSCNTKQLVFRHRKHNVWINYKYDSGYLVFTYYDPKDRIHFTVKTIEPASKVVAFHSPMLTRLEKPEESDVAVRTWPQSKKSAATTEERTVLQRIFALIRSNA